MRALFIGLLVILVCGCAQLQPTKTEDNNINHVVLIWLKERDNTEHQQAVIDASLALEKIPGITELRVGKVVESDRPVVDDSFDIGVYMLFENEASMQRYTTNPEHGKIVKNKVLPLAKEIRVYDFVE